VILASGPDYLAERVKPVCDAIGQRTMWVGAVGASTRLKLGTNSWILAVVKAGAETIALAEGLGLDLPLLRAIRARLSQGAQSHGEKDMSATYPTSAPGTSQ
jgi:3-hydroxyisobutyrate dehydrogenase-like beta-hydroxyacid dehydrogenase